MALTYRMAVATKRFVPGPLRRWLGAQLAGWTVAQWRRDEARVVQALGTNVAAGPFAGMRYVDWAWGALGPKLVGTYELEIADALEAAIAKEPTLILNAGCAEGYYAVGLLMRLPGAGCIAWDRSERARDWAKELASINGVADRLELRAEATATAIQDNCLGDAQRMLIICDIEGGELEVLDPAAAPQPRRCTTIIAELHEHLRPGLTSVLTERFKSSHHVELINSRPRERGDIPDKVRGHLHDWRSAIDERRITEQQWMVANLPEL